MLNKHNFKKFGDEFKDASPYPYLVIDDFFDFKIAERLEKEFPSFESKTWHEYNNSIELKKVCNNWNSFPSLTYQVFKELNSVEFTNILSENLFDGAPLFSDPGLNGGGWHIHGNGGKLNPHLDYSIHPKMKLQRRMNLIVYLTRDWQESWGGHFGIWGNNSKHHPGEVKKKILPKFNRAVIFDTTKNSWHGLPEQVNCPSGVYRKSIAVYYLTVPEVGADERNKALFAPTKEQENDEGVLELIKLRASDKTASKVWKK